ncbi:MAG: energy transducer TonB [Verrucomicrobiota bacterium]|nr:energy transducer TonB [Verrucomicrobiota bacterium]
MKTSTYLKLAVVIAFGATGLHGESSPKTLALPVPTYTVEPTFSLGQVRRGDQGEVKVLFRIDEQGNVRDLTVEEATDPDYAQSVVNAVRNWRFAPVTNAEGQVITPLVRLPVKIN